MGVGASSASYQQIRKRLSLRLFKKQLTLLPLSISVVCMGLLTYKQKTKNPLLKA